MKIKFYMKELVQTVTSTAYSNFWTDLDFSDNSKDFVDIPDNVFIDMRNFYYCHEQTNFTTKLIQLIMKSDQSNFTKLASVYPNECYICWCYENIEEFTEKYLKGI